MYSKDTVPRNRDITLPGYIHSESTNYEVSRAWACKSDRQTRASSHTSCMILGTLFNPSAPQIPFLLSGDNNTVVGL